MIEISANLKLVKVKLSSLDYDCLTQLYLPLVGSDSISLYLNLNNHYKDEVSIRLLLDELGYANAGAFSKSLYKLEAIGLVKELEKKDAPTIICLNKVPSPKSFLSNPFLKTLLINKIGEVEYENIEAYYKDKKQYRGYKDVTKSFDEVFKRVKANGIVTTDINDDDNIIIRNSQFDYTYFKLLFNEEIDKDILNDETFKDLIIKISYQYELNEQEMHEAVIKSLTINNDIDIEKISMHAGYIYQNRKEGEKVVFTMRDAKVFTNNFDATDLKLIEMCKNNPIPAVLTQVNGVKGSLADVRDFNKLQEQTGLAIGVINALIVYLGTIKQGENLSYTYIEKVARKWQEQGVTTVEDAFCIIKETKEKRDNPKKGIVASIPDWLKDEVNTKDLTDDEIKLSEKLKKEAFGDDE